MFLSYYLSSNSFYTQLISAFHSRTNLPVCPKFQLVNYIFTFSIRRPVCTWSPFIQRQTYLSTHNCSLLLHRHPVRRRTVTIRRQLPLWHTTSPLVNKLQLYRDIKFDVKELEGTLAWLVASSQMSVYELRLLSTLPILFKSSP